MLKHINYHLKQEAVEKRYAKELIAILLLLIQALTDLQDIRWIDVIVRQWLANNMGAITASTEKCIYDLEQLSDSVMSSLYSNSELTNKLISANIQLVVAEINKIKEQFVILDVQHNNYGLTLEVIKNRIGGITQSMENSIKLLAVNQSIQNFREMTIQSAIQHKCTEYLGMTQNDDRVRQEHKRYYHDKWIRFDDPPPIGHVGTEINCRCMMINFR